MNPENDLTDCATRFQTEFTYKVPRRIFLVRASFDGAMQNGISKLDVCGNGKEKNVAFIFFNLFYFKIVSPSDSLSFTRTIRSF